MEVLSGKGTRERKLGEGNCEKETRGRVLGKEN